MNPFFQQLPQMQEVLAAQVSQGCCDEAWQTGWLRATPSILPRSWRLKPEVKVLAALFLLRSVRENLSQPMKVCQKSLEFLCLWTYLLDLASSLHGILLVCVSMSQISPFVRTPSGLD